MAQDSAFDLLCVDDSFFSALFHEDEEEGEVPFTDYEYAQRLQLQEVIFSSLIASRMANNNPSSSFLLLPSSSSSPPSLKMTDICPTPETEHVRSSEETDESLKVICEICVETKGATQIFKNGRCHHSFCSDCVTKQVATKIQDGKTVVSCPGLDCQSDLELDDCRPWLPKDLVDRWGQALCETLFLAVPKLYCPFKDCSAMLLVENEEEDEQAIREAECPVCHKLFCARCHVPWHAGVECEEFQSLNEHEREREDLLLRELANEKEWGRCPQCKFYVEKIDGCLHITCRSVFFYHFNHGLFAISET